MGTYPFVKPAKTARDERIKQSVRELHAVHHTHAAKAACLAHLLHMVSNTLLSLHKKMHKEAIAVADMHYKDDNQVCINKHGPLADHTENGDLFTGPGIIDIVDTARAMAAYAARIAGEATLPLLPSE
jgi:hypothetical protein